MIPNNRMFTHQSANQVRGNRFPSSIHHTDHLESLRFCQDHASILLVLLIKIRYCDAQLEKHTVPTGTKGYSTSRRTSPDPGSTGSPQMNAGTREPPSYNVATLE